MPGFFITNSKNSPKLRNYDDTRCVSGEMSIDEWSIKWNHLNKFMDVGFDSAGALMGVLIGTAFIFWWNRKLMSGTKDI